MTKTLTTARWATFAMFLANGFGFGIWATGLAPLKTLLSLSAGELSIALLAMSIGGLIAMQPASHLTQKVGGTGRAMRLAGFGFAGALTLPFMAPHLGFLIAACALLGAAGCLMGVSMNAHASKLERDFGKPIMSSFHAGFSLGGLLGTGFGALLLTLHMPTQFLMLPGAFTVLMIVASVAGLLGPGDTEKHEGQPIFRLPEKSILGLAAILTLSYLSEGAMADWSGIYLTSLGESPAKAAAGYAAFSATMVLGRFTGDQIVHHFGRSLVIGLGSALAASGLLIATMLPSFAAVIFGFALVGVGFSNVVPCIFSLAAQRASSPAAGIAAVSTAGFGGFLSGPPLIGAVAAHHGMRAGIGVIAVAATIAALLSLRVKVSSTSEAAAPAPTH
ncbi:MFS family permease [Rhizomicrobium palustre]|uniref:MFS family permease n=1 Tax=Rhizomicrobium palustre TaxID=189966 RepID=A0A846MVD2_9PROT|nr:MFS transporter [Rhizomicrobium palustre]NIK86967.1 MFS family permease [Rhizomicrobium palustre]